MELTFAWFINGLIGLAGTAVAGFFAWQWADYQRLKNRVAALEIADGKKPNDDKVREIIKEELDDIRADVKSMADSMITSVQSIDARLNELMLSMINHGNGRSSKGG